MFHLIVLSFLYFDTFFVAALEAQTPTCMISGRSGTRMTITENNPTDRHRHFRLIPFLRKTVVKALVSR